MQFKTIVIVLMLTSATACATVGSGCQAYKEQRLSMPDPDLIDGPWLDWVSDTDERLKAVCKG